MAGQTHHLPINFCGLTFGEVRAYKQLTLESNDYQINDCRAQPPPVGIHDPRCRARGTWHAARGSRLAARDDANRVLPVHSTHKAAVFAKKAGAVHVMNHLSLPDEELL